MPYYIYVVSVFAWRSFRWIINQILLCEEQHVWTWELNKFWKRAVEMQLYIVRTLNQSLLEEVATCEWFPLNYKPNLQWGPITCGWTWEKFRKQWHEYLRISIIRCYATWSAGRWPECVRLHSGRAFRRHASLLRATTIFFLIAELVIVTCCLC